MDITYEIYETESGQGLVKIDSNGKTYGIPFDLSNADYQAYLASLEETA